MKQHNHFPTPALTGSGSKGLEHLAQSQSPKKTPLVFI